MITWPDDIYTNKFAPAETKSSQDWLEQQDPVAFPAWTNNHLPLKVVFSPYSGAVT